MEQSTKAQLVTAVIVMAVGVGFMLQWAGVYDPIPMWAIGALVVVATVAFLVRDYRRLRYG